VAPGDRSRPPSAEGTPRPSQRSPVDALDLGTLRRLNWGCGPNPPAGWINSDRVRSPGVHLVCDILLGLPVPGNTFDYIVSIHALEQVAFPEVDRALAELRRVLRRGGTMRLSLPDLDRAVDAYKTGDRAYFLISDSEVSTLGGKLCVQMSWYGSARLLFTYEFAEELLCRAGFADVRRCAFRQTASAHPAIVELDDRERESLFVEAVK